MWYDMIYDTIWYDVIWYDLEWYDIGLILYDIQADKIPVTAWPGMISEYDIPPLISINDKKYNVIRYNSSLRFPLKFP